MEGPADGAGQLDGRREIMTGRLPLGVLFIVLTANGSARAQSPSAAAVLVTVDNYNRAESDVGFAGVVKDGGFGKFVHIREPQMEIPGGAASKLSSRQ
jgi:hypothetical protein